MTHLKDKEYPTGFKIKATPQKGLKTLMWDPKL